ncbi:MAG: Glycerol-3-phosphate ABC transporter, substrate-binding protein UgpB [uncultured Chloroflexia bacterium]|uniref:Glycerol-3-phosphate ABC transporter, substrate-binding protein UgpB n=1 Tax=uncultured Chloroflexia bacterium TaxID=1672391 RepID=A0A6J4NAP7_9CHLR|nr:MAG: Glycerol-3-phosphate ABC transporter, substrate-binding protein UgpB [uncultured Chloroflexia bacterium]
MSKLNRRKFLTTSSSAIGALVLAACGAGGSNTGGAGTAATAGAPATAVEGAAPQSAATTAPVATSAPAAGTSGTTPVVFWSAWGGKNGEGVQKLVDDFNKSQTAVVVENQFQGSYEETSQKLSAAMAAQQIPDMVALSEVTWNRFYINQTLQPLDELFTKANFDPTIYVDPLINEGTRQGKIWWVPFARSTPLLYFNRDLFKQAGLPETGPETWDQIREYGPELMKVGGENMKVFAFTTAKNYNAWHFQGNVWQWGGAYSDKELNPTIDEPAAVAAGEWLRTFVHEDKMGYMADDQSTDFINGLCAMTSQSTGSLGGIATSAKFAVGTAMLPQKEKFGCPTGGAGLALLAGAPDEKKQAAMEFIKFLSTPENVAFWSKHSGYMPSTDTARDASEMQQVFTENPNYKVAVDQLPKTQPQDTARLLIPNGDQTIGTGLERIMANNEPADKVFAEVAAQLERDAQEVKDQLKGVGL